MPSIIPEIPDLQIPGPLACAGSTVVQPNPCHLGSDHTLSLARAYNGPRQEFARNRAVIVPPMVGERFGEAGNTSRGATLMVCGGEQSSPQPTGDLWTPPTRRCASD